MNDPMKLHKDQKLITLTEEKYNEMKDEIKELHRHLVVIQYGTWDSRRSYIENDLHHTFYFSAGDKVEERLGEFWLTIANAMKNCQRDNDKTNQGWMEGRKYVDEQRRIIDELLDKQKFVPKWMVRIFGNKRESNLQR